MLSSLTIHNIVTISSLHIEFCKGLSILTGETGAGKSILLDALGLVLGNRSNPNLIRLNEDNASVTAVFSIEKLPLVKDFLADQDITLDGNELILRRKLFQDGRNKIFLNDMPISLNLVRQLTGFLVDIHGQFDRLLEPKQHQVALDLFANINITPLNTLYKDWKTALKKYKQANADKEQSIERRLFLQDSIKKLRDLNPQDKEEELLLSKRHFLMNSEKIRKALDRADQEIYAGQVESVLMGAYKTLLKISEDFEGVKNIQTSLDQSIQALQEAVTELQNQRNNFHTEDNLTLEEIESRIFNLREQARRHQCDTLDLPTKLNDLEEELEKIDGGESHLENLKKREEETQGLYLKEAKKIREIRISAGKNLTEKIKQELIPLKLDKIQFEVQIEELSKEKWSENGIDQIEFYVSTNVGQKLGPLQSVASGGELSRIMLALKVILNQSQPYQRTLIFDEIDTGLGGAVADAMGRRLKLLSKDAQVLSITHSPQIAAHCNHHLVVRKMHTDKHTETGIDSLVNQKDREQEIARMISGASITKEAQAAASKLLKESAHG